MVIEHDLPAPFSFGGQIIDRVYTRYMHLDSFAPFLVGFDDDASGEVRVSRGDVIGFVGDSGQANTVHLHYELRIGTWCSLEYQLANPGSSCVTGFDPHVNPVDLFGTPARVGVLSWSLSGRTITLRVESTVLNINGARLTLKDGASVIGEALADFNTREGFDASSTEALDNGSAGGFIITPDDFSFGDTVFAIEFGHTIDDSLWASAASIAADAAIIYTDGEDAPQSFTVK